MSLKIEDISDIDVINRVNQWENFYISGIPIPPIYNKKEILNNSSNDEYYYEYIEEEDK